MGTQPDHQTTGGAPRGVEVGLPLLAGSAVGIAGGATFVGATAGLLPVAWSTVAWVAGALLLAFALWATFGRRHAPLGEAPRPGALAVYLTSVLGMLALIAVGTQLLPEAQVEQLRPALIALAVGLHFLPFAWAFPAVAGLFRALGLLVAILGALGLALGLGAAPVAGAACAVLAGTGMLALIGRHNTTH